MILHIREEEVAGLVNIEDAIAAVEIVGRMMASSDVVSVPRTRLRMDDGTLQLMPASLRKEGVFGYKAYTSFKGKARFLVHLFEAGTGSLLSIIEADKLGQLRTGAASAVATGILSRRNVSTFGLIGSGYQAETQLLGVLSVREFSRVKIFSRNTEHARLFCERMQRLCRPKLEVVREVDEAAACDVVTTVTSSMVPVLPGDKLKEGDPHKRGRW